MLVDTRLVGEEIRKNSKSYLNRAWNKPKLVPSKVQNSRKYDQSTKLRRTVSHDLLLNLFGRNRIDTLPVISGLRLLIDLANPLPNYQSRFTYLLLAVAFRSRLTRTARLIMSGVDVMLARREHIWILPTFKKDKELLLFASKIRMI
jgi:hypothetical protein